MKKDVEELASRIVELVGGKENITFATHCATRLRFNVLDKSDVNEKALLELKNIVGSQWSGEQLQVIVGSDVANVYKEICRLTGLEEQEAIDENLDAPKAKFSFNTIMDVVSASVAPMLPILIGCSFIKILVLLMDLFKVDPANGTYQVLSFAGDAGFYFMPIFVGANAARKLHVSIPIAMLLGAILIHPNLINAVKEGTQLSIFGINFPMLNYASGFLPILLTVCVMKPVESLIDRYSPKAIKNITVPFLTLLIMIPLALVVLGPVGNFIGTYLGKFVVWLYETLGFIGVALMAAIAPLVIATGMHGTLVVYAITLFMQLGYEPLVFVTGILATLAQGAASLGVALRTKDSDIKSNAIACFISAVAGGISEPALFGISLKYKKALYAAMIGGALGGAVAGLAKCKVYTIASAAIYNIVGFLPGGTANFVWMCVACVVSFAGALAFALILYKDPESESEYGK